MKRIISFTKKIVLIGLLVIVSLFLRQIFNSSPNIFSGNYNSKYIYVMNRENKNEIIKEKHKSKVYPASLTKIMTTIVALEHIEDLSAIAPVDVETYKEMVDSNASMAGFYGGEQTTYRDLLYGTVLSSGGEAANSLAINVAGDKESFVTMMNKKAEELGLEKTHFINPEGLHHKNQYTTASDMAELLDYALENGDFRAIFTKNSFKTSSTLDHPEGVILESTVLSKLDAVPQNSFEIIGGKSGTTKESGQSWITLGIKNDKEYIVVVMGAKLDDLSNPNDNQIKDTIKIYDRIE